MKYFICKKEKDTIIYYEKNDFPDIVSINSNTEKNPKTSKIINLNIFVKLNKQLSSYFKVIEIT